MSFTKEDATAAARKDLAQRLNVDSSSIDVRSVTETEFPDMSLGAATAGEMSAQMITSGWKIMLGVDGKAYEYRADKYHLRLVDFDGKNYVVK